ncbi:MAG: YtxH domain-containing protein [Tractidigestivibacter sp.]|jgi:gas vesicle protein|uniref:YtxH domain-containing protein n=1 Tax=Tractidigestivibacter sp. TaxID=2847320 RepID=UPI003D907687
MSKTASFVLGSLFGAACGVVVGIMMAPRTGAESRAMAADAVNDAWDSAIDTYERGARSVNDRVSDFRPSVDAKSDELRAKVDLARERMDQLRDSLSDAVSSTSSQVSDAMDTVTDRVATMAGEAASANETPAASVNVEVEDASTSTDPAQE